MSLYIWNHMMSKWRVSKREQRIYGGLSADHRRTERRARLMAAGIVCFGRDGYAATTTRSIAAESGLTQRYFYESFEGIDDFFAQIVLELGGQLEHDLREEIV